MRRRARSARPARSDSTPGSLHPERPRRYRSPSGRPSSPTGMNGAATRTTDESSTCRWAGSSRCRGRRRSVRRGDGRRRDPPSDRARPPGRGHGGPLTHSGFVSDASRAAHEENRHPALQELDQVLRRALEPGSRAPEAAAAAVQRLRPVVARVNGVKVPLCSASNRRTHESVAWSPEARARGPGPGGSGHGGTGARQRHEIGPCRLP